MDLTFCFRQKVRFVGGVCGFGEGVRCSLLSILCFGRSFTVAISMIAIGSDRVGVVVI